MTNRLILILLASLAVSAAPAMAQGKSPRSGAGKYDTNKPIEINADTLEVFQDENRAVFSGNVVAIQGQVRLKSDRMNVFYRNSEGGKKDEPGQDAIQKIEVTGNVFLSTPEETASGATGIYDVENRKIHLSNNVVLTREKNVLKGDNLVYDFATGRSVIKGGVAAQQNGKGRVRALFVPDKAKKE